MLIKKSPLCFPTTNSQHWNISFGFTTLQHIAIIRFIHHRVYVCDKTVCVNIPTLYDRITPQRLAVAVFSQYADYNNFRFYGHTFHVNLKAKAINDGVTVIIIWTWHLLIGSCHLRFAVRLSPSGRVASLKC